MNNGFVKFIFSLPVVMVALYFLPVLGIIMLLIKYFGVNGSNRYSTASICSSFGFFILIPKAIELLSKYVEIKIDKIPYLTNILSSDIYDKLVFVGLVLFIGGVLGMGYAKIRMKSYIEKASEVRIADAEYRKED